MQTSEARTGTMTRPKIRCSEANMTANGSTETQKKTIKTVGKEEWGYLKDYVKKRHQPVLSMGEKLDILLLHSKIQYKNWGMQNVLSLGRMVANVAATERVASLLRRKMDLVEELWRKYANGKPFFVANTKGNYRLKSTKVPRARLVATTIQNFVRERRKICQRTLAKYFMKFLDGCGFIAVDQENNKDVKYVLRSM